MLPPGSSLAGPSANMLPSQSQPHQPPAVFNNQTAITSSGMQLQGQPPPMMSVNKPPPQAGILPPPSSNTGLGYFQHQQFPPPPKAGTQPTQGPSLQNTRFPPPPSASTYPPVGIPPQQMTSSPPMPSQTEAQAIRTIYQTPANFVSMSGQPQAHVGGSNQPNQPPVMSTMTGPPLQTSNINQIPSQSALGTMQSSPPTMFARQPPSTSANTASNTFATGPPMSVIPPSSNITQSIPPMAGHVASNLSGPPLSMGTVPARMPPPTGNLVNTTNSHLYR